MVRSAGVPFKARANGPSPRAFEPWHAAQYASNESFPTNESPRTIFEGGAVCACVTADAITAMSKTANRHVGVYVRISPRLVHRTATVVPRWRVGISLK